MKTIFVTLIAFFVTFSASAQVGLPCEQDVKREAEAMAYYATDHVLDTLEKVKNDGAACYFLGGSNVRLVKFVTYGNNSENSNITEAVRSALRLVDASRKFCLTRKLTRSEVIHIAKTAASKINISCSEK